ncbi:NAD-dependent succinate-semialdehyde dehydrogenase [Pseudomonas sp. R5(2019)]|uniref:NAD-dependent succinate-semialdehyde dehydrogenase n=1 Tax=Pseudomonas sp. R5(2019) TaxID=2697566 RepID=UPI0014127AD0|nr:NAD-dependent succinate-semialdehyde dehydrogenase [Pseudomonas sp. R5(2019)]NBA96011.1 aldehyde dehydrogenase family protein [Pseudomonas sp. R5(2019)]
MIVAADYPVLQLFLVGRWQAAAGRVTTALHDPASGTLIGHLPHATADDLDQALNGAESAFKAWRQTCAMERGNLLKRAAQLLRERLPALAANLTLEQGKPLTEARIEIAAAADIFEWFAEEGRRAYGRIIPSRSVDIRYQVLREPVGPVAAFAPWNFPAVIPARKIAAALASGCTCIIKPAEETPATCLALAQALSDAGLPAGVLSVVTGDPGFISDYLLRSNIIRKISFTGSTAVGRQLGSLAAQQLQRSTLELGGHAPVLVFEDADLDRAAAICVENKFRNAGQVCISPTRFYVHERVHDAFVQRFVERTAALKVGHGLQPGTQMGPLANSRRPHALKGLIEDALDRGAELHCGGQDIGREGHFFRPTLLARVPAESRVMQEEPFGPLALTSTFSHLEEALELANRLPFGLAAYGFTESIKTAHTLSNEVECGMLGINNMQINFAETPFGGVKHSGFGSEGGSEGLDGYLSTKLISLS